MVTEGKEEACSREDPTVYCQVQNLVTQLPSYVTLDKLPNSKLQKNKSFHLTGQW